MLWIHMPRLLGKRSGLSSGCISRTLTNLVRMLASMYMMMNEIMIDDLTA